MVSRSKILIVGIFLSIALPCMAGMWMMAPGKGSHGALATDVTIDSSVKATRGFTVPTLSVNITVGSHSNRVLYVIVFPQDGGGQPYPQVITSSLGGTFEQVGTATTNGFNHVSIFRLVNPTIGTHTITITWTSGDDMDYLMMHCVSLYNVDTSDPDDTVATDNPTTGSSFGASVTLTSGEMAIGGGQLNWAGGAGFSLTTGTVIQGDSDYISASNTGIGSVSLTFQNLDNLGGVVVVVPVNKAP